MNKKILVGIAIAIIAISIGVVGAKTIMGDKAIALPNEEPTEKALNIQENKTTTATTGPVKQGSSESTESGP
jgi:hypothetical protein